MNRSFAGTLKIQLLWLTGCLALARFLTVEVGAILPQLDLPASLTGLVELRARFAPFVDRAALIAATVVLILGLPSFVRKQDPTKVAYWDEILALGNLCLIGVLAINALAHKPWSLGLANATLAALFLLTAIRLGKTAIGWRIRLPLAFFALAGAFPLIWRLMVEFEVETSSSLLSNFRKIADSSLLLGWGGLILTYGKPKSRLLAIPPILIGVSVAAVAMAAFGDFRHILASISGLWFTTLPPWAITALTSLAAWAFLAAICGKNQGILAFGLLIMACSGHVPGNVTSLVFQALGLFCLTAYARAVQDKNLGLETLVL